MATSIRLAPEIEQRLDFLASQTGRTKAFYLRELIERGLEDMEDYYPRCGRAGASAQRPGENAHGGEREGRPFALLMIGGVDSAAVEGGRHESPAGPFGWTIAARVCHVTPQGGHGYARSFPRGNWRQRYGPIPAVLSGRAGPDREPARPRRMSAVCRRCSTMRRKANAGQPICAGKQFDERIS